MKRGRDPTTTMPDAMLTYLSERDAATAAFYASTFVRDAAGKLVSLGSLGDIRDIEVLRARLPTIDNGLRVATSLLPGAGNGLFVTRDFAAGELITFYDGPIAIYEPPATVPLLVRSHMRALVLQRYMIVGNAPSAHLGEAGRGGGAMINDARSRDNNVEFTHIDATPNMQSLDDDTADPFAIDPFQRVIVARALRAIPQGAEVYVSYGPTYWKIPLDAGGKASSELNYVQPKGAVSPVLSGVAGRRMRSSTTTTTPFHCA